MKYNIDNNYKYLKKDFKNGGFMDTFKKFIGKYNDDGDWHHNVDRIMFPEDYQDPSTSDPNYNEEDDRFDNDLPIRQNENDTDDYVGTGFYNYNDKFKLFNAGAQAVTGIANYINDAKSRRKEHEEYLKYIVPKPTINYNEDGLNNIPMFPTGGKNKQNPPKVYTDPVLYNGAAQSYNDSLALYKKSLESDKRVNADIQKKLKENNSIWKNANRELETKIVTPDKSYKLATAYTNGINENILPYAVKSYYGVPSNKLIRAAEEKLNKGKKVSDYGYHERLETNDFGLSSNYSYDDVNLYKMPVQPVKYQPQQKANTQKPQTINTTKGKVTGTVKPNQVKGSQLVNITQQVNKPTHPINRLTPLPSNFNNTFEDDNIQIYGKQIPLILGTLPQQQGIPFYGPGNTIVGYTDNNRQFYPANQYTGAQNNQSNLQDQDLLNNPELLKKYVLSKDNYIFKEGGLTNKKAFEILRAGKNKNGKPLTDAQKKFFFMMGTRKEKKEEGGYNESEIYDLDINEIEKLKDLGYTLQIV